MDIVIKGGQGVGKTRAAEKQIADFFKVDSIYKTTLSQLLLLNELIANDRVDIIRETVRAARVEAVLFDGCLTNDTGLLIAVQAVKEAREQIGRNLFAVYVVQSEGDLEVTEYPTNINISQWI